MDNQKIKIAFINIYQDKVMRGAETFVSELGKRLASKYSVDILTRLDLKKIFTEKYDCIIPTNGRMQVFAARIISSLLGARLIVSGQSGIGLDDRLNLYAFPDTFVALSDKAVQWARKINPFIKVVKIPNGVDVDRFFSKTGQFTIKNNILSVGAFTKEKRHDLTIKAVAKIPDANLLIVGSGGEFRQEIEALGNKLLKGRFMIKSVPHKDMPKIYREAKVLAFASVSWESFGIAIVEAMATNVPVVAGSDEIRKEIVGDAGLLVDPSDTDAYSEALNKVLKMNWGRKPRNQALNFSWDVISTMYENLIEKLVKKNNI